MISPLRFFEYGLAAAADLTLLALSAFALAAAFVFVRGLFRRRGADGTKSAGATKS